MGILDQILHPIDPDNWVPAAGHPVTLKEPINSLWADLKGVDGKVKLVEMRKPPHKVEPTGRLEAVFLHNGVERTIVGFKDMFVPQAPSKAPKKEETQLEPDA